MRKFEDKVGFDREVIDMKTTLCYRGDCFANAITSHCNILTNTKFKDDKCPFYKHRDTVDIDEIERACLDYTLFGSIKPK